MSEPNLPWKYSIHRPHLKVTPLFKAFLWCVAFWWSVYFIATR